MLFLNYVRSILQKRKHFQCEESEMGKFESFLLTGLSDADRQVNVLVKRFLTEKNSVLMISPHGEAVVIPHKAVFEWDDACLEKFLDKSQVGMYRADTATHTAMFWNALVASLNRHYRNIQDAPQKRGLTVLVLHAECLPVLEKLVWIVNGSKMRSINFCVCCSEVAAMQQLYGVEEMQMLQASCACGSVEEISSGYL